LATFSDKIKECILTNSQTVIDHDDSSLPSLFYYRANCNEDNLEKSLSSLENVKEKDDRPDYVDGISENIDESFADKYNLNNNSSNDKQKLIYLKRMVISVKYCFINLVCFNYIFHGTYTEWKFFEDGGHLCWHRSPINCFDGTLLVLLLEEKLDDERKSYSTSGNYRINSTTLFLRYISVMIMHFSIFIRFILIHFKFRIMMEKDNSNYQLIGKPSISLLLRWKHHH